MVCSRCGKPLAAGTSTCAVCGAPGIAPLRTTAGAGGFVPPRSGFAAPRPDLAGIPPVYAGFWLRALAYLIDGVVVYFASVLAAGVVMAGVAAAGSPAAGGFLGVLAGVAVSWLYFALLESSSKQATLGKMALGLAVTDAEGRPIGFGRATGRVLAKLVSALPLYLGFVVAGFTAKKQALHDMIASTLVVRRRESGVAVIVAAVAAACVAGIVVVGILAAIAIPNFIRYQLRAKGAEATTLLASLHQAELQALRTTGRFVALEAPRAGVPGSARLAWGPDDLAAASAIAWPVEARGSYFTYRVEAGATPDGRQAYSACAESDLDGDGKYAAVVVWQPALDDAGAVVALPPDPPCRHEPALARSPRFELRDPIGVPVRISPQDVH